MSKNHRQTPRRADRMFEEADTLRYHVIKQQSDPSTVIHFWCPKKISAVKRNKEMKRILKALNNPPYETGKGVGGATFYALHYPNQMAANAAFKKIQRLGLRVPCGMKMFEDYFPFATDKQLWDRVYSGQAN